MSQEELVTILLIEDDPAHAEDRDAATEPMRRFAAGRLRHEGVP